MIDDLDSKILDAMNKGIGIRPRLTGLASELGEKRGTINLRVSNLEKKKILLGFRPKIDWQKLGYDLEGYIGVICPDESIMELVEKLKGEKTVFGLWELSAGKFDLLAKCRFRNNRDIKELQDVISSVRMVKDMDVWLTGPCHKE